MCLETGGRGRESYMQGSLMSPHYNQPAFLSTHSLKEFCVCKESQLQNTQKKKRTTVIDKTAFLKLTKSCSHLYQILLTENWLLSRSQSEGYSSKWLVWLACGEPLLILTCACTVHVCSSISVFPTSVYRKYLIIRLCPINSAVL